MRRTNSASWSLPAWRRGSSRRLSSYKRSHAELMQRFVPGPRHRPDLGIDNKNIVAKTFDRDLDQVEKVVQLFFGETLRK